MRTEQRDKACCTSTTGIARPLPTSAIDWIAHCRGQRHGRFRCLLWLELTGEGEAGGRTFGKQLFKERAAPTRPSFRVEHPTSWWLHVWSFTRLTLFRAGKPCAYNRLD